jgi:hypothetical protein
MYMSAPRENIPAGSAGRSVNDGAATLFHRGDIVDARWE